MYWSPCGLSKICTSCPYVMATHSGRDSSGWSCTCGKRTNTPLLALPSPGASSRNGSRSEKSPKVSSGNQSMPMPWTSLLLVSTPPSCSSKAPPPTCSQRSSEAWVPSNSLR